MGSNLSPVLTVYGLRGKLRVGACDQKTIGQIHKECSAVVIFFVFLAMQQLHKNAQHFHSGPLGHQEVVVFCVAAGWENVLGWDFIVLWLVCWEFNKIPQWRKYSFTSIRMK